jgi:Protein of unknown function (DUF4239)
MSDWFHNLPIVWMALLVFGFTYLVSAAIYAVVMVLAAGERGRSFKAVSPGMLPPLGIIFGLFVGFTAARVWTNSERASAAVDREASTLRSVEILAAAFPGETQSHLDALVSSYIATLRIAPRPLADAMQFALATEPTGPGQQIAQRNITAALENALDARRQRITISQSEVNWLKWVCLYLQAACALVAIAMVHSDNRVACAITMGLFATGVAGSALLIASYDRPFIGEISVGPAPLLQVMPVVESDQ